MFSLIIGLTIFFAGFIFGALGGWFIVTATISTGQISNHYKNEDWDLFRCDVVEKAPEFDGHTSSDVLERLKAI